MPGFTILKTTSRVLCRKRVNDSATRAIFNGEIDVFKRLKRAIYLDTHGSDGQFCTANIGLRQCQGATVTASMRTVSRWLQAMQRNVTVV